jgi:hypothetical protein
MIARTFLCSYYYYLIHKLKIDPQKSESFCEILRDLYDSKKIDVVCDVLEDVKYIVSKGAVELLSPFSEEPNQVMLAEMLQYKDYYSYLRSFLSKEISVKNVKSFVDYKQGYVSKISFCSGKYNVVSNGVLEDIDEYLIRGLSVMQSHFKEDFVLEDRDRWTLLLNGITGINIESISQSVKDNVKFLKTDMRCLKGTIMQGMFVPCGLAEMKKARGIILKKDFKVPLFVNLYEKVDGVLTILGRDVIIDECKVDTIGFDYFGLVSSRQKIKILSAKLGYFDNDWDPVISYHELLNRKKNKSFQKGDKFGIHNTWLNDSLVIQHLKYCELHYVGGSDDMWNWVSIYTGEKEVRDFNYTFVLLNIVPKLYKLMVLFGAKTKKITVFGNKWTSFICDLYGLSTYISIVVPALELLIDNNEEYGYKVPYDAIVNLGDRRCADYDRQVLLSSMFIVDDIKDLEKQMNADYYSSILDSVDLDELFALQNKCEMILDDGMKEYENLNSDDDGNGIDDMSNNLSLKDNIISGKDELCVKSDFNDNDIFKKRRFKDVFLGAKVVGPHFESLVNIVNRNLNYSNLDPDKNFEFLLEDLYRMSLMNWDFNLLSLFIYRSLGWDVPEFNIYDVESISLQRNAFRFNMLYRGKTEIVYKKHRYKFKFKVVIDLYDEYRGVYFLSRNSIFDNNGTLVIEASKRENYDVLKVNLTSSDSKRKKSVNNNKKKKKRRNGKRVKNVQLSKKKKGQGKKEVSNKKKRDYSSKNSFKVKEKGEKLDKSDFFFDKLGKT